VVRALGPSLAVDGVPLPGALQDPTIELHGPNNLVVTNDNWMDSPQKNQIMAAGLAPNDLRESAIFATLAPGEYTAIVAGVDGTTGVGLVEAYDLSTAPAPSKLANISSRSFVGTDDDVLIGGIIVRGISAQPTVFRAIGPDVGVAGALPDPTLDVHDADGTVIAANDNWRSNQETEITASGLAPGNDLDAAIIVTLSVGNYTAVVRGADEATGIALVEAFALE
jgi:hypothetical protein